jgi:hypothetical protein
MAFGVLVGVGGLLVGFGKLLLLRLVREWDDAGLPTKPSKRN